MLNRTKLIMDPNDDSKILLGAKMSKCNVCRAIENQLFIFLKPFVDVSIKTDSLTIKLFCLQDGV